MTLPNPINGSWADHVRSFSKSKAGMALRFIPPTLSDSKTVVSPQVEIEDEGAKQWEKCLVGYFLDSSIP